MMVKELYENICKGVDTRANLIELKKEIKEKDSKRAFVYLLGEDFSAFTELLKDEDAKVRKNAALILGEMENENILPILWEAYEREEQLFVKPSFLKAMTGYNYKSYLPDIKERMNFLAGQTISEADTKHIREELSMLRTLLLKYESPRKHRFKGFDRETEVILLTNREHREVTVNQLGDEKTVLLAGGVRVRTKNVKELLPIRTYSEMLFPIPQLQLLPSEPTDAARKLSKSGLLDFLKNSHSGSGSFYFRIEIRGKIPQDQKSVFIKKFSTVLERETGRGMLNSPSEYEIELRLLEKKGGGFIPLLKLYTLADKRFAYRKNAISVSIAPVSAALIMELLKPWLKEGAQVLDPFCGAGTMLIERRRLMAASPIYGVDIYPEAIEKARENAKAADVLINFINRDILDFKHEYLFDEIITNMPTVSRTKGVEQVTALYEAFFIKSSELLKSDGFMALYTTEESILIHCLKNFDFLELEKKWTIREREGSVLYLLSLKKN